MPLVVAQRLAIAALVGLAVGIEREWSGPASGPGRRFAGLRTFLMFGLLGGIAGILLALDQRLSAAVLLAGGVAFVVAAFVTTSRREGQRLEGTTEGAALVVLALGSLAGIGYLGIAAGTVAIVVFALGEKEKLHWLVSRIGPTEMHATMQFLVLALVVLPLLPTGPYPELWDFRPRSLWTIVVALSALNFIGYLARRAVGPTRGYTLTGILGGLVSSTAVSFQFSRLSRTEPEHSVALSFGTIAACTVVPIRVVVVTAALNANLAAMLAPLLLPAAAIGIILLTLALRNQSPSAGPAPDVKSPLRFGSALQMALLFQVAMIVAVAAQGALGSRGLVTTGVLLGVADADALAVSMSHVAASGDVRAAARAIVAGVIASSLFKATVSAVLGSPVFRRRTAAGLLAMTLGLAAAGWWGLVR